MTIPEEILIALIVVTSSAFLAFSAAMRSMVGTVLRLNTELRATVEERRRSEIQHDADRATINAGQARIAALEVLVTQQRHDLDVLQRGSAAKDAEIVRLQGCIEDLMQQTRVLKASVEALQKENQELKSERALLIRKVADITAERDNLRAEVSQLRAEVEEIKRRGTGPLDGAAGETTAGIRKAEGQEP